MNIKIPKRIRGIIFCIIFVLSLIVAALVISHELRNSKYISIISISMTVSIPIFTFFIFFKTHTKTEKKILSILSRFSPIIIIPIIVNTFFIDTLMISIFILSVGIIFCFLFVLTFKIFDGFMNFPIHKIKNHSGYIPYFILFTISNVLLTFVIYVVFRTELFAGPDIIQYSIPSLVILCTSRILFYKYKEEAKIFIGVINGLSSVTLVLVVMIAMWILSGFEWNSITNIYISSLICIITFFPNFSDFGGVIFLSLIVWPILYTIEGLYSETNLNTGKQLTFHYFKNKKITQYVSKRTGGFESHVVNQIKPEVKTMDNEKYKEFEKKLLLHCSDKYPKSGLIKSCVNELKNIGFVRILELSIMGNDYGSIWLCDECFLAIRRDIPGVVDSGLKLKFFDASVDAELWLKERDE